MHITGKRQKSSGKIFLLHSILPVPEAAAAAHINKIEETAPMKRSLPIKLQKNSTGQIGAVVCQRKWQHDLGDV